MANGEAARNDSAVRSDGRNLLDFRPPVCERSVLSRADGSAQWTQGHTSVIAAVYGPRPALARKQDATQAVVEVTFRPRSGLPGSKETAYESHIQKLLESVIVTALHPRTCLSIILQVVQEDGSVLACALNAVGAALLDAAVPMKHMFAAACCAITDKGMLLMDPDAAEEQKAKASVSAAFGHHRGRNGNAENGELEVVVQPGILTCLASGVVERPALFNALGACNSSCQELAAFSIRSLQRSLEFKV